MAQMGRPGLSAAKKRELSFHRSLDQHPKFGWVHRLQVPAGIAFTSSAGTMWVKERLAMSWGTERERRCGPALLGRDRFADAAAANTATPLVKAACKAPPALTARASGAS